MLPASAMVSLPSAPPPMVACPVVSAPAPPLTVSLIVTSLVCALGLTLGWPPVNGSKSNNCRRRRDGGRGRLGLSHVTLLVGEDCMCAICPPQAPLPLPHYAAADCIHVPRGRQLLHLHIHATQHVEAEIGVVDEVCEGHWAVLIIHNGNAIVQHALEPEVEHPLTRLAFTQRDGHLVPDRLTIHAIDVTSCQDDSWTLTLQCEVHQHIVEYFLD